MHQTEDLVGQRARCEPVSSGKGYLGGAVSWLLLPLARAAARSELHRGKIILLKYLEYKNFSFNLAKQISYKQKQTRYGRAINFGETKERKNEQGVC